MCYEDVHVERRVMTATLHVVHSLSLSFHRAAGGQPQNHGTLWKERRLFMMGRPSDAHSSVNAQMMSTKQASRSKEEAEVNHQEFEKMRREVALLGAPLCSSAACEQSLWRVLCVAANMP
jgi:hypothetical protein